jgi:hypothetical protein
MQDREGRKWCCEAVHLTASSSPGCRAWETGMRCSCCLPANRQSVQRTCIKRPYNRLRAKNVAGAVSSHILPRFAGSQPQPSTPGAW